MEDSPRSFLFIRLKGIGETVMLLPLVDLIHQRHPDAEIEFVVGSPCHEILEEDPRITRIHVMNRAVWKKGNLLEKLQGYMAFTRSLRGRYFDLVVDFHGNRDTQSLARLTRCRRRVGRASGRWTDTLLDQVYPADEKGKHNTENLADILRSEGIEGSLPDARIHLSPDAEVWAKEWILSNVPRECLLIGLNPGAGIIPREWPAERFAAVGRHLVRETNARIVVHGGPGEEPLVRAVVELIGKEAVPLLRPHLRRLAALCGQMDLFITNDTGPMHVAAAAGGKVLALFGNTRPANTGPFGGQVHAMDLRLDCSPCANEKFLCWHSKCMDGIRPADVIREALDILHRPDKPSRPFHSANQGVSPCRK